MQFDSIYPRKVRYKFSAEADLMHDIKLNLVVFGGSVLASVQEYAVLAVEDEKKLINKILKANDEFKNKSMQRYEKSIRESKNRIKEIDGLLQNLYEDKILVKSPLTSSSVCRRSMVMNRPG